MSIILKILGGTSILLLVCTLICGLWVRVHPQEDMQFHFVLSLAAVVAALVTITLFMLKR